MTKSGYLLFFVSLLPLTCCLSQKAKLIDGKLSGLLPVDPQGHVCYKNVFSNQGLSKQELVKRAKKWFDVTYASPGGKLPGLTDSTGTISSQGRFIILETRHGISRRYIVRYRLSFTAKSASYDLTISQFFLDSPHTSTPIEHIPHAGKNFLFRLFEQVDEHADELVSSLRGALTRKADF